MFPRKPKQTEPSLLDLTIAAAISQLDTIPAYSDEYAKIVAQIEKLNALKNSTPSSRVSPDTLAIVIGNLVGIGMIVGYERANAVTSKAVAFVMKAAK